MNFQALDSQDVHFGITGYFDAQTVSALEDDFQTLINDGKGRLILDLSQVDFIDSSGIGSIVFLYKRLRAQSRELILDGVNGQPERLISSLRVDKTITTYFKQKDEANDQS